MAEVRIDVDKDTVQEIVLYSGTTERKLPQSWTWTTVGNLYDMIGGGTPSTKVAEYWKGTIPWITSADILGIKEIAPNRYISAEAIANSATNLVPKGSIIVVTRVGLGKVALADQELCFSQDSQALVDKSGLLNPNYALYYLSQAVQIFKYKNQGTTIAGVTKNQLASLQFPLPPLAEQGRIVSKIEELFSDLDAGETGLRKAQKQMINYRHSVVKAALTGELTKSWREANKHQLESPEERIKYILQTRREQWQGKGRYQEPQPTDTTKLPKLPDGWIWVSVEQILVEALTNGRSVPDADDGFPVLRLTAVRNGKIDLSERKIGAWSAQQAAPYLVRAGDFFVTRGNGSKKLVGRGGLVAVAPDQVAFPDTFIRVRIIQELCQLEYLSLVWASQIMRSQIEKCARTTAGIYKINQQDISSFLIPLPPLEEQQTILAEVEQKLSVLTVLEETNAANVKRVERLRQSILKAAFSGQLVPQDPTDEPASELLKRIRAKREEQPAAKPQRNGPYTQTQLPEIA